VDQMDAVYQSGSADHTDQENAADHFQNEHQEESVIRTTTHVQHTTSVDSVKSASSSMSVVQICSLVGLAFVGVAAVIFLLRRARHSKA